MALGKGRLGFDTGSVDTIAASDSVGAFLRASDGTLLTHTDISGKKALDVNFSGVMLVNDHHNAAILSSAVTVGTTEVALVATALTGRREITIQNLGNRDVFVGATGVLAADGLMIPPNSALTLKAGPDVDLYAIADGAGQDVRVLEAA